MRGPLILTSATPDNQIFDSRTRKRKARFSSTQMGQFSTLRGEFRFKNLSKQAWNILRLNLREAWWGTQAQNTTVVNYLVTRTLRYIQLSRASFRVSRVGLAWLRLVSRDTRLSRVIRVFSCGTRLSRVTRASLACLAVCSCGFHWSSCIALGMLQSSPPCCTMSFLLPRVSF